MTTSNEHRQSIEIEIDDDEEPVTSEDVEETVRKIETQLNQHLRSGTLTLSSGKTARWWYEQPVH
jgi:hypothetical protein